MLLAVRISSYGCTWEVWRTLKKLELLSAAPRATLTLLSCSPNFLRASITRFTHAKHEPVLKYSHTFVLGRNYFIKFGWIYAHFGWNCFGQTGHQAKQSSFYWTGKSCIVPFVSALDYVSLWTLWNICSSFFIKECSCCNMAQSGRRSFLS